MSREEDLELALWPGEQVAASESTERIQQVKADDEQGTTDLAARNNILTEDTDNCQHAYSIRKKKDKTTRRVSY